ncbi:hypothetical protein ZIOFF_053489 [Zingiber officinale]|uniref:Uncharacterized protein n=1 Tax=Zingiber officinale TaxID=94328 RepID=A0A8J5F837_ZINOF|nr:hypothetical protein ZIOFF_053489 [Zingiber officinale]
MGNSMACPCSKSPKERVLVMRSDGSLLKLKKGVTADEVAAVHVGHKVVCCGPRRSTVVPGTAELDSKRLYFLMPADRVLCQDTFDKFWSTGESKLLLPARKKAAAAAAASGVGEGKAEEPMVPAGLPEASEKRWVQMQWRPKLKTIEEIASPALSDFSKSRSPEIKRARTKIPSSPGGD